MLYLFPCVISAFIIVVPRLWLNIEDVMSDRARPGTGDRPSTAGVHVTDIPQGKINPAPVAIDETEILIEEYLSPRKLVSVLSQIRLRISSLLL